MGGQGSKHDGVIIEPELREIMNESQYIECKTVFGLFDHSGDGVDGGGNKQIDVAELADALVESGFDNVSKDEIQAMMREVDTDDSGSITFPEFAKFWVSKMGSRETAVEMLKVYQIFETASVTTKLDLQLEIVARQERLRVDGGSDSRTGEHFDQAVLQQAAATAAQLRQQRDAKKGGGRVRIKDLVAAGEMLGYSLERNPDMAAEMMITKDEMRMMIHIANEGTADPNREYVDFDEFVKTMAQISGDDSALSL